MELWLSSAEEKNLQLRSTLDRDIPARVLSDSGRIRQVLNNFISNAIKFTDEGKIILSVEHKRTVGNTAHVRFEVTDSGPGIGQSEMEKLFVPFVQADAKVASDHGGWGLGLSICNHLAELLEAKIGVTSKPGQGSTFFIDIPLQIAEAPDISLPPLFDTLPQYLRATTALRILVAEDNLTNQEMLENMITQIGHKASIVKNGYEAVSALKHEKFDLVLMDISMPGLDGVGATEQIRALSGDQRKIPIIAVTGSLSKGALELYKSMGMNDCVAKPIQIAELGEAIKRTTLAHAPA